MSLKFITILRKILSVEMNYKKELNNIHNKLVQKAQLGLKVQSYSDGSVENGANKDIYNTPEYAENYSKGLYYGEDPQGRIYLQENANPELARYAKFVQDYPFEKYMNDTYFSGTTGAIAKGLGQSSSKFWEVDPSYKKNYDAHISRSYIDDFFNRNPKYENEERGQYLDRVTKGMPSQISDYINQNLNPENETSYWSDAKTGLDYLLENNFIENDLENSIKNNHNLSSYEKQKRLSDLEKNPVLSRLSGTSETLSPLNIGSKIIQSTYRPNYNLIDALQGHKNNAGIVEDIATDPLNLLGSSSFRNGLKKFGKVASTVGDITAEAAKKNTISALEYIGLLEENKPSTLLNKIPTHSLSNPFSKPTVEKTILSLPKDTEDEIEVFGKLLENGDNSAWNNYFGKKTYSPFVDTSNSQVDKWGKESIDEFVEKYGNTFSDKDIGLYGKRKNADKINDIYEINHPKSSAMQRDTRKFAETQGFNRSSVSSPDDKVMIESYTRGYDSAMNRRTSASPGTNRDYYEKEIIPDFENIILRNKITEPATVYRHMENYPVKVERNGQMMEINLEDLQHGDIYEPKSFLSTSLDPKESYSFGPLGYEIDLPKKQSYLIPNEMGRNQYSHEKEVVLPEKLKFLYEKFSNEKGLGIRGKFKIMNPYVTIPTAGITGLGASQIELKQKGGELRPDGTKKGKGFFGALKNKAGEDMTEYSIGVEWDGKEHLLPTLVPGLGIAEKNYLMENNGFGTDDITNEKIIQNAIRYAQLRESQNQPFFASSSEEGKLKFKKGGQIKNELNALAQKFKAL